MEAFRAAVQIARDLGDAQMLATAAVGFEEACWRPGIADAGAVELLEEASLALGEEDAKLRVMLLAGLGRAHAFTGNYAASAAARASATAMARRLDDRLGLATVLMRSYWSRGEESLEETLDMLTEAVDLAAELGDSDLLTEAMEWRIAGLIALGDLHTARREQVTVHAMAERLRQPFTLHVAEHYAATIALCVGRLAEAEAAARRVRTSGAGCSPVATPRASTASRCSASVASRVGWPSWRGVTRLLAAGERSSRAWRPGLAALLAELGMHEEARRELALVRQDGFDSLRASLWLASLTYLADACAAVGDTELASLVYAELAPLTGANVMIGHGVSFYGAADRYLGLLAATLGDHDRAIEHYRLALERNRAMGATTWVAHTLFGYGQSCSPAAAATTRFGLGSPRRVGDARRARRHADAAGARTGARRARRAAAVAPDELTGREVDILRLVARGAATARSASSSSSAEHTAANHVRSILRKTGRRQPHRGGGLRPSPRTRRRLTALGSPRCPST